MHFRKIVFEWFDGILFLLLGVIKKIKGKRVMSLDISLSKVLKRANKTCAFVY